MTSGPETATDVPSFAIPDFLAEQQDDNEELNPKTIKTKINDLILIC
jgi:hypothetical protein